MTPQQLTLSYSQRVLAMLAMCALLMASGTLTRQVHAESIPVVAAAASMRYAMDDIAATFERRTGQRVRFTYGATRSLMHQIENGAPYELFLAADEESVWRLADKKRTEGTPSVFARGRIAIVAPSGSPVSVDGELTGLTEALAAGDVDHVAIANPEVAPYGRAAREVLQKAGIWEDLGSRLIIGENVGQAAQFVTTGAAQAGIIAYSLVASSKIASLVTVALIPEDWHQPINHSMTLLNGAGETARALAAFLKSEQARAILERNGLSVP
ncbi:MAG: molybdate ABC transporter substrate-binding protein [Hyphomicrobium sp.]|nr:molybdate ABC transporter substrate-binding protein [Hyphomicrobium sp.]